MNGDGRRTSASQVLDKGKPLLLVDLGMAIDNETLKLWQ